MGIAFTKYEGLGNDFVVVDAADPGVITAERARALCDRHFGIGADGVLLVTPPSSGGARARMHVINADGSRPEMCGNGLRCVGLHLALRDGARGISYLVDTDSGPLSCEVDRDADRAQVRVCMGRGVLLGEVSAEVAGAVRVFQRVSMGNPHAVCFDVQASDEEVDRAAAALSASVPGGTNVELAVATGADRFDLVVWERGVGRTLACGTGAAATAVAATVSGRATRGATLQIRLPGGGLELSVDPTTLEVLMRGPARRVFSGETS